MEGDHTHNLIYLALLCIVCTQASFSDYVSIKNQSINLQLSKVGTGFDLLLCFALYCLYYSELFRLCVNKESINQSSLRFKRTTQTIHANLQLMLLNRGSPDRRNGQRIGRRTTEAPEKALREYRRTKGMGVRSKK